MKKILLLWSVFYMMSCYGSDVVRNDSTASGYSRLRSEFQKSMHLYGNSLGVDTEKIDTELNRLQKILNDKTNKGQCSYLIENYKGAIGFADDLSDLQGACVHLAADVAHMKPFYHTLSSKYDLPVGVLEDISTAELVKKEPQELLEELEKKLVVYNEEVSSSVLLLPFDEIQKYKKRFDRYFDLLVRKKVLRDPLVLGRLMNMRDYLGLTFDKPYNSLSNPYFIRNH